jgi:tRNA threonylcarbamoyladenosine modification (KEOPS) complex  Pcc1 subunit
LTASFAQTASIEPEAIALAGACAAISAAQRVLSTPVRRLRRRVARVDGSITLHDGAVEAIDATTLRSAPERALRWMSLAMPLLALGLLLARLPS